MTASEPSRDLILDIGGLRTSFFTDTGEVKAVDGVSLQLRRGRTTCIVGESGSGKSALARSVLQVVDQPGRIVGGRIDYRPAADEPAIDLAGFDPRGRAIRAIRGKEIGMIFQEPMAALSPVHTIGRQIADLLTQHEGIRWRDRRCRERIVAALEEVGIPRPEERFDAYTFQLSGGMRQRAMIAMAMITRPRLLIADEPTTALDVTTQAQILDLLRQEKENSGMSLLFITHDLGVVAEIADDVVVMRHGAVQETGPVDQIFSDPQHSYTRELLDSLPQRAERIAVPSETASRIRPVAPPPAAVAPTEPILTVEDLRMEFRAASGRRFRRSESNVVKAVDGVSFAVPKGRTLGIVGESGCGKTTLGRTILRAYRPTAGMINYAADDGVVDLAPLSERELLPYRQQIRMVFQDPYGSLNPRMTVADVVTEPLRAAGRTARSELEDRAREAMLRVGLQPDVLHRYPHAFSGGQRQRISIARALITEPTIVVADEAVSALDVSVRAQVLDLFADLQQELGLTYLFISHDLSVVERSCDEVAVMYFGKIVEHRPTAELFTDPQHGYTKALLSAVPISDPAQRGNRQRISYRPEEEPAAVG
ncbi:ABC transporter ATP-binding protein [Microlunatus soli]|uniref:Peptide/nickel transport system ATP-binding protein n=1 Tax=Microlunatus soli TaxID=630515 RepID=A0A1H1ZZ38_9ACTN|nr:ABC transporter ATP-binding protein [Microlunatus soli]SDT38940.1 peptide/nickel transport system ATP-binding protein [Microlunatus soli]